MKDAYLLVIHHRVPICIKCVTYPDGRDFVGTGIQQNVPSEPTIDCIAAGRDIVLEIALEMVKAKMAKR